MAARTRSAIIAMVLVACTDATTPAIINGTYSLRTIGGNPIPVVIRREGDFSVAITTGRVTLNGDLTFSDAYTFSNDNAGVVTTSTIPCTGTWAPTSERSFTVQEDTVLGCGATGSGEWDGRNRLTIDWSWTVPGTMVHRR
jgi:hypothetical protein